MDGMISVRVDKTKKDKASKILKDLGLDLSTAINIYINQIIRKKGIPFSIEEPNEETKKAILESRDEKNLNGPYDSIEEFVMSLDKGEGGEKIEQTKQKVEEGH